MDVKIPQKIKDKVCEALLEGELVLMVLYDLKNETLDFVEQIKEYDHWKARLFRPIYVERGNEGFPQAIVNAIDEAANKLYKEQPDLTEEWRESMYEILKIPDNKIRRQMYDIHTHGISPTIVLKNFEDLYIKGGKEEEKELIKLLKKWTSVDVIACMGWEHVGYLNTLKDFYKKQINQTYNYYQIRLR